MFKKLTYITVTIILSLILVSCATDKSLPLPTTMTLEQSIKEIIQSKGENYDFLQDDVYTHHMNKLSLDLNMEEDSPIYALGDLDGDNIPELAFFRERNPNDINDEGSLEVYKFNGEKYILIDSVSMNFDNTNYQIVIGKISKTQQGILLNNQVGAHSGMTYGFILENNKIQSILQDKNISLISIYTDNEIKDIDDDGILEFSICTVDPETKDSTIANADKMFLWYKWDGVDSGVLVHTERNDYSKEDTNPEIFDTANNLINTNLQEALLYMEESKDSLSNYDNTRLLSRYIKKLDSISFYRSIEINDIFLQYQGYEESDYIFKKYELSMDKLNTIEYLNREKVLKDEEELKKHLIEYINLGFKLVNSDGNYSYSVNYQKFINIFSNNIFKEYRDYMTILALESDEPLINDGKLSISREKLVERILQVESFKFIYPYSEYLSKTNEIYKKYAYTYFYGDNFTPTFDYNNFTMKDEFIKEFETVVENYKFTNFADIIREFLINLKSNNNIINDNIRDQLNNRL